MQPDPSVETIAETLAWHEIVEMPIRRLLRIAGCRYECLCDWQSATFHPRDHDARAVEQRLARQHQASQVWEALNNVTARPVADNPGPSPATRGKRLSRP